MTESGKIVIVNYIIDFRDIQVWLRQLILHHTDDGSACKFMTVLWVFRPKPEEDRQNLPSALRKTGQETIKGRKHNFCVE